MIYILIYAFFASVFAGFYYRYLEIQDSYYSYDQKMSKTVAISIFWPLAMVVIVCYNIAKYLLKKE